jgi:hypothetical protein
VNRAVETGSTNHLFGLPLRGTMIRSSEAAITRGSKTPNQPGDEFAPTIPAVRRVFSPAGIPVFRVLPSKANFICSRRVLIVDARGSCASWAAVAEGIDHLRGIVYARHHARLAGEHGVSVRLRAARAAGNDGP